MFFRITVTSSLSSSVTGFSPSSEKTCNFSKETADLVFFSCDCGACWISSCRKICCGIVAFGFSTVSWTCSRCWVFFSYFSWMGFRHSFIFLFAWSRLVLANASETSGQTPKEDDFCLPSNLKSNLQYFDPFECTSRYKPPPSDSLNCLVLGSTFLTADSVSLFCFMF